MEKLFLEWPEAWAALGIRKTLFGQLVARGEITSVRVGRRRLIPAASLREFADRLTAEAVNGAAGGR